MSGPSAWRRALRAAAVLALAVVLPALLPGQADAQQTQTVQSDWSLIPAGIGPGQSFRLLFVTSTTDDSFNQQNYNGYVQARAAANTAISGVSGLSGKFRALVSSFFFNVVVHARDKTATTFTNTNKGVPIYWLGGAKVADDYADFYDGSWDSRAGRNEFGSSQSGLVVTGSNDDGTRHTDGVGQSTSRFANVAQGATLSQGSTNTIVNNVRYYALSPVITVQADPLTAPPAPTGVKAWGRAPTEIFVSWTTQSATPAGQAPVTGYKVEMSTDAGATWTQVARNTRATHANYTHTGLAPETTRHYRVRATSAAGDGAWSDAVSATTPAAGAPAPPKGFAAAAGNRSATLSWTDPINPAITGWEYRWRAGSGSWSAWTAMAGSGAGTVWYRVTGLTNGVRYHFQVRAVAGAAKGVESAVWDATPPGAARGLTAEAGAGSVTLTWADPMDPAIAGWEYQWMTDGGSWSAWTPIAGSGAGTTSHTVRGLLAVRYAFRVRAVYAGGVKGLASGSAGATPLAAAAAGAPERPAWLTAAAGDARVTLAWERGAGVHGFQYRQRAQGVWSGWLRMPDYVADDFRHAPWAYWTVTGLTNGAAHHFQVRAVNGRGAGPGSDAASATPSGSIPAVAVSPGRDRLTVSWAGAAVTRAWGYTVQWKTGKQEYRNLYGGSGQTNVGGQASVSGTQTSFTIGGLEPGTVYGVRVMYSSDPSSGDSPLGEVRAATLGELGAPGRVAKVWAQAGDRRVEVSWDAVFGADGYKVQWRPEGGTWDAGGERAVAGEGTTSYTVAGLEPGTRYAVRVIATRAGAPDAAPSEEKLTRASVDGVWAAPGAGGLNVRWTPWDGAEGYTLQWKRAGAADYARSDRVSLWTGALGGATSYRLSGLAGGETWTVRVTWYSIDAYVFDIPLGEATAALPVAAAAAQLSSAAVRGDAMAIRYDAALDARSAPASSAYTVTASGAERGVAGVSVAGREVTLRLASAVGAGEAVTVDYTPPPGAARLRDAGGVEAAGFSGVPAENGTEAAPLTASIAGAPSEHTGAAFTVRIAFSAPVEVGATMAVREGTVQVEGARVTRSTRVDGRLDLWELDIEPGAHGEVTVRLAAAADCAADGAICTADGRALASALALTVPGPAAPPAREPLTASIAAAPSEHGGKGAAFTVRIAFSSPVEVGATLAVREGTVRVKGARVTRSTRVDGRLDLWEFDIEPRSHKAVTLRLPATKDCAADGAICTADGRRLSAALKAVVDGPPALSVADAKAKEGRDATIDFAVTLSRAAPGEVTVDYATRDGTAKAGEDYTAASGTLTFAVGETEKTVSVALLDDAHDEGKERFRLRLRNARGARIEDGVAVGTIRNDDHMPQAWIARFGRTVTGQVLDAVTARLEAPRTPGGQASLAGQALPSWAPGSGADDNAAPDGPLGASSREAAEAVRTLMAHAGASPGSGAGSDGGLWNDDGGVGFESRALTGRDFVTGTSFALTGGSAEDGGGSAAFWGRGAITSFDGREGELTLDGEVSTGLLGADWATERWTAGLAVGHSRGTGGYREGGECDGANCAGKVEAVLTGVYPYAGLTLTERLSVWAAAGYGSGELTMKPEGGEAMKADLAMTMGAAGARSEVLRPEDGDGLALAVKGDARFTRTSSSKAKGGGMAAADADVWLLRAGIEGSRRFALGGGSDGDGATFTPSFEVGARLDGGDAETGLGADVGGGIAFADPKSGLALDLKARGLLAHEASGFREWGASAALAFDPRPSTDRGLSLTLTQSWGASPAGGMDALLSRETRAGLAANDDGAAPFEAARRLEGELGYGIAMFDGAFTGKPNIGFGLSDTGRDYRLGWRLTSAVPGDPGFEVNLDATRSESAGAAPGHGVMLRGTVRW